MNRFARLATRVLAVPLGLVWLEPAGEAAGALPECWPPERVPAPEVLECCRRVAESGFSQFLARAEDGVAAFAFAGVPLIGGSGEVLGVLAVMDPSPRVWSEDEVRDLSDLAAACSAQMRMRKRSENGRQAREAAEDAAYAAEGRHPPTVGHQDHAAGHTWRRGDTSLGLATSVGRRTVSGVPGHFLCFAMSRSDS
ncbi:GAF domain-containing protein [Streptomyces sp. CB02980]|uniref:GAF domain-containing protein n=1 Tax=Streptomyces sp. NPDC056436 TaxID=3345815 RepID=UPI001655D1AE|nr:GAF domain-containing protein [Streptomyces sp. CB02980]